MRFFEAYEAWGVDEELEDFTGELVNFRLRGLVLRTTTGTEVLAERELGVFSRWVGRGVDWGESECVKSKTDGLDVVTDGEVACFWDATFALSGVNSCKPTKSKLVILNSLRYEVQTQKFKCKRM